MTARLNHTFYTLLILILPFYSIGQSVGEKHYYRSMELLRVGDLHGSADALNEAIIADPVSPLYYSQRAKVRLLLHKFELAETDYNRAQELNFEYVNAHSKFSPLNALSEEYKGYIYTYEEDRSHSRFNRTNPEVNKRGLDERIDYNSFDTSAYLDRAYNKYLSGDFSGAEVDISIALKIDSLHTYAFYLSGCIREKLKDFESAKKHYTKAIELDSMFYLHYYKRAIVQKKLENYDAAIDDFYDAEWLNRNNALIPYNRSVIFLSQGDLDNALLDLDLALKINPALAEAYFNRAFIKKERSDFVGALNDYSSFLRLKPKDAMAHNNKANIFMVTGEYDRAREYYDMAISLEPEMDIVYVNRGINSILVGNKNQACSDFDRGVQRGNAKAIKKQALYCD